MKRAAACLPALCLAATLFAQQFQFNLKHLEAKASDVIDLSLSGSTLQFAAKFLDGSDPDEAKVKKLIGSLEGIYVKNFQFKAAGAWLPADLDNVRNQLRAPEWSRIIGIKSAEEEETAEVYVRYENKKVTGVAILAADPKELTVVNIVGPVDLDQLGELSGHFGLPKLLRPEKEKKL